MANVYVNGQKAGEHNGGYTGFRIEITDLVQYGMSNRIDVMVDNSYSKEIAPISGVIDGSKPCTPQTARVSGFLANDSLE